MEVNIIKSSGTDKVRRVEVYIGGVKYTLTESIDNKLCINKAYGDGTNDAICVFPRVSNEIEII